MIYTIRYILYQIERQQMTDTAKIFTNGRSQAVRLPAAYRFDTKEVFVRRDKKNGDVILSRRPDDWHGLFSALEGLVVPEDFLSDRKNVGKPETRDPLDGLDTG